MQALQAGSMQRSSEAAASRASLVISIHSNYDDFERLRPEWEALRPQDEDQDPFLSCDWFATWWRAFGGKRKLRLVTARRNGRLRAVLPMMLERSWRYGFPLRRLAAIGNDHTARFDLVRAGDHEQLHRAIWDHLMRHRNEWDVLDFPRLSADSITAERFIGMAQAQCVPYDLWPRAPKSPWIDIGSSWDNYLNSRSASFRKTLRRKLRQLAAKGEVELETITAREALESSLAEGFRIEAEGWKGSNSTAILSQQGVADFYTRLAEIMAIRAQLRLHFLTVNGVRIAFDYSIIANRCLYSLKAGHSTAHASYSPGTLLLGLILQEAHEEGLVGMDLLGDSEPFKMHWTHAARTHPWLHCYSDSLRGRLFHLIKSRLVPLLRAHG